ncbi:hypothetical protein J1614_007854 [Plenodomus biglobosus]|nr:hypothetical protein J1614_007854 [Plenodomus biglobosus]
MTAPTVLSSRRCGHVTNIILIYACVHVASDAGPLQFASNYACMCCKLSSTGCRGKAVVPASNIPQHPHFYFHRVSSQSWSPGRQSQRCYFKTFKGGIEYTRLVAKIPALEGY